MVGAAGLEVSQGDALAGVVSRPDLAAFTVELARSEALTFDTALEIYTTQSAQPCEGRFIQAAPCATGVFGVCTAPVGESCSRAFKPKARTLCRSDGLGTAGAGPV